jgi:hypothetical protein
VIVWNFDDREWKQYGVKNVIVCVSLILIRQLCDITDECSATAAPTTTDNCRFFNHYRYNF